jgi:hypothetical protein
LEKVETEKSNNLYLYIDLPRFDFPVIFSELVRFLSCIYVAVIIASLLGNRGFDASTIAVAAYYTFPRTSSTSGVVSH